MELKVGTKNLATEIGYAISVVEHKSTIPILSHLFLQASDGALEIAATDLEVTFKSRIPCEVLKEGGITVPAKSFAQITRGFLDSDELTVRITEERKLSVIPASKKSEYFLNTLPVEDFPRLITHQEKGFSVPLDIFKKMVKEVFVSIGPEDSRFSISGVLFMVEPKSLTMVSTDSHRLSYSSRNLEIPVENQLRILVPKKILAESLKFEGSGDLKILVKDNQIFLSSLERVLYSRLKDVKFPAWEKVIPKDVPVTATLNREGFLEMLKRISYVSDSKTRAVSFEFKKEGTVRIETRNEEGDTGNESYACDSYAGEDVKVTLNCDYLADYFSAVQDDVVTIKMKDSETQCLIESVRQDQGGGVCINVIMPLRTE